MERSEKFYNKLATLVINKYNSKWIKVLEELYKDNYYLSFSESDKKDMNKLNIKELYSNYFSPIATIYFPKIEITNGVLKRTIYDLYVHLVFGGYTNLDIGFLSKPIQLLGTRVSFTLNEIGNAYGHSHLASAKPYNNASFNNFCTGSGPISDFKYDWNKKEVDDIKFFFNLLEDYLKWESISGVPYHKMESLGYEVSDTLNIHSNIIKAFITNYKCNNVNLKLFQNGLIQVNSTDEFELLLGEFLYKKNLNHLVCNKTSDGKYVKYSNNLSTLNDAQKDKLNCTLKKDLFYFKNEMLKTKLINVIENDEQSYKYPHPSITRKVCEYLSNALTNFYYTKIINSRITGENTTEDTSKCIEENSVSVS